MSIEVMNRIWWRDDIAGSDKWVLLALADASNDDGICWMAVETIAIKAGLKRRAVQYTLKSLEAKTLVAIRRRTDRSSYFAINLRILPLLERPRGPKDVGMEQTLFDGAFDPPGTVMEQTGAFDAPLDEGTGAFDARGGAYYARRGAYYARRGANDAPRTQRETKENLFDSGDLESPVRNEAETLTAFVERRYNEVAQSHPGISGCRKVDSALGDSIRARAREHLKAGQTEQDVWEEALSNVATSRFLRGEVPPRPGSTSAFRLSLGWMATRAHFREIIGGKYNGQDKPGIVDPATGRRLGPTAQAVSGTISRLRAAREQDQRRGDPGRDYPRIAG